MPSVTPATDIFKSSIVWFITLLLPILILLIDNHISRSILFTLFPVILAVFVRYNYFWVDKLHIISASFIIGGLYLLVNLNKKNKEAIGDTEKNKTRSSIIFGSMAFFTVLLIAISGTFTTLYIPSNFRS